jgi:subtilisin family serine protease
MDAVSRLRLTSLMAKSTGRGISIGVIDGPVDLNHEAFTGSKIRTTKNSEVAACRNADNIACIHGTFVTGILTGRRETQAPALCPDCEIILRPIFPEEANEQHFKLPSTSPEELAQAIVECIKAGADIINLSLGLSTTSLMKFPQLEEAYAYAIQKGIPIVVAAGNQGQMGYFSILNNPWIIPVVACDPEGRPEPYSNISPSIAKYGLMAPGINVTSASAGGGFRQLSGTSFATPFVTGTMALLWSLFKDASAHELVLSLRNVTSSRSNKIFPPLCDAQKSESILEALTNPRQ